MQHEREIRQALTSVGLSESAPQVIARMEEFGSNNINSMSPVQMKAFLDYIRGDADRKAAGQRRAVGKGTLTA